MSDIVIRKGGCVIQHGKENDRVYLMKLSAADAYDALDFVERQAADFGYTKIVAKIPASAYMPFSEAGYTVEARVPRFFNNTEECFFMSRFLSAERAEEADEPVIQRVLSEALGKKPAQLAAPPSGFTFREAADGDTGAMSNLYGRVFATYPFPIQDKEYLLSAMQNDVRYFGVWFNGELAALSSCELAAAQSNAEMTDFATAPEYRGKNLSLYLLDMMEKELKSVEIHTAYTIARARSFGMNITFSKAGYSYAGRLINNTNISGQLQSMNVWYKPLFCPGKD